MADKTVQIRRYQLIPGDLPAFLEWWEQTMVPAREAFGYTIEFGLAVPERSEFVWAVSLPLARDAFVIRDAEWMNSPERKQALSTAVPLVKQRVNLVDQIR
ncbi:MAG: hypothetical protein ABJA11_07190 [Pseudolysinimonas sp.]